MNKLIKIIEWIFLSGMFSAMLACVLGITFNTPFNFGHTAFHATVFTLFLIGCTELLFSILVFLYWIFFYE